MNARRYANRSLVALLIGLSLWLPARAQARPQADSVILFIGDGMGPNQVAITGLADGAPLAIQKMPYSGTVTTLALGNEITDSAAAGTALATGHKTQDGMLSTLPDGQRVETIAELCRKNRKSVGIMSLDALWGATPAAFAAHAKSRGEYASIAQQMAKSGALVMMGVGKDQLLPTSEGGKRTDKQDLIAGLRKAGYDVVTTKDELAKAKPLQLVGLFGDNTAPRLADMVKAALPRLAESRNGFFLVVEHPHFDWEPGDSSAIVGDGNELDEAVQVALDFARKRGHTLVVVTADHETGGLVVDDPRKVSALHNVHEGAGDIASHLNADRSNIAQVMAAEAGLKDLTPQETAQIKTAKEPASAIAAILSQRAGLEWTSNGDHTGTPVRVFAFGPGAERFAGSLDNTQIPGRIADALGLGPFPKQ